MPATQVQLSANTNYALIVVCNAANYQKAMVTVDGGQTLSFAKEQSGVKDNQMISPSGQTLRTGGSGIVKVDIYNSSDNVKWNSSKLQPAPITLPGVSNSWGAVVGSEDGTDNDYNDCVVMLYPADR